MILRRDYLSKIRVSILLVFLLIGTLVSQDNEKIVKVNANLENEIIEKGKDFTISVILDIDDGWHINSNKPFDDFVIPTEVTVQSVNGIDIQKIKYPKAHVVNLESLGGKTSTFVGKTEIEIIGLIDSEFRKDKLNLDIDVRYQGCNDEICLAPITKSIALMLDVKNEESQQIVENVAEKEAKEIQKEIDQIENEIKEIDEKIALTDKKIEESSAEQSNELTSYENKITDSEENEFGNKGFLLILVIVFFGGLALNLTPCVYPLIPITIGYFANQSGKGSSVLKASMYVVGISITYSVLGTVAALSGSMMGSLLSNPIVLISIAVVMVLLSLSMFGVYEFRLPSFLMNIGSGAQSGAIGSLIMGLTMGIIAAPCVGPFVIGLLTYVAKSGNPFVGLIMFFTLSLGLGLPYLFLGIFSDKIGNLPKSGEWLNGVRIFFGLVLVGMALYFVNPLVSENIRHFLLPGYMIFAGIYYAIIDNSGKKSIGFLKGKMALSIIVISIGVWLIKPAGENIAELDWEKYSIENLETADENDKIVMIDFFADWCIPCIELDELTFSDKKVQEELSEFVLIKADLTKSNEEVKMLREKYKIKGVPTIIFLDEAGNEIVNMRMNGFMKAEKFIKHLRKAEN
ncbi:MAG: protein-disulfide reductase DsbD [Candidatus Marinimicrobia bacterium]|nr:protein-disulfide reductase DsbD [Candidatus Neomarinimicrobiota bacterium]